MTPDDLAPERAAIDALDDEILRLLNQRLEHALQVGEKKKSLGLPLHDPARERRIYEKLKRQNEAAGGKLPATAVTAIYREIISACRNAEHALRVAFLGPAGTNTQEAAAQFFGSAFTPLPCGTPDEICREVARGGDNRENPTGADYGVMAIENSIHGIVSPTLDLLANSPLWVCAEVRLLIHHCLLSNTELGRITKIYSHEQALAQCRNWLINHLPDATLVPVTSTARGAQMAMQEEGAAAIGASIAANIYGLQIAASNIEDLAGNKTRFFVVARAEDSGPTSCPPPTGRDKTSLTFITPHKPGALVEVLDVFRRHEINISMIQSRPSRQQAWEYRFFADLQAHRDDEKSKAAFEELQGHTVSYKILGSYPQAE